MTATHDDQEPQITDPSQLIEVFEDQRLNTLRHVDIARQGMAQVKDTLNHLLTVPGQDEAAVDATWAQLKPVRQILKQIDAVMVGAYNVIETLTEQRDEVAQELDFLNDAIDNRDTDHPRLKDYAETIELSAKVEGHTEGYDEGYDEGIEYAMSGEIDAYPEEELVESVVSDTANQWNIPTKVADDLICAIRGEIELTNEQREAFRAFIATF